MSSSALLVDRWSRGRIRLKGSERASFLHGLLTNDITNLTPGTGTYAAYLTPQGRMISDMRVVETGEAMLLDVEASVVDALARKLDSLVFAEDVTIENITVPVIALGVHGESAIEILAGIAEAPIPVLARQFDNAQVSVAGCPATIVRDDYLGLPGFDLYVFSDDAQRVRAALLQSGASEADDATTEALRIDAGRPRFGVDMDTDTIPLEAGLQNRAISFTKGCYVGQEMIIRVMHRGHGRVARRLVRLTLRDGAVPVRGEAILAGETRVGEITSAARSTRGEAAVALGYVHRDQAAPGVELVVGGSQAVVEQLVD